MMLHPRGLLVFVGIVSSGGAAAGDSHARYVASLLSVPVARIEVRAMSNATTYAIKVSGTYGLPGFTRRFTAVSSGRKVAGRPQAVRYQLATDAEAEPDVAVRFVDRRAVQTTIVPEPPSSGQVPLLDDHRENVVDPLSALFAIASAPTLEEACRSAISVYTGLTRFDVDLGPVAEGPSAGRACEARYALLAGHRPGDRPVMKAVVTFPNPAPGSIHLPAEIRLETAIGTLIVARTDEPD